LAFVLAAVQMTLQSLDSVAKVTIEMVEELESFLDAAVHWHLDCLAPIVTYSVVLLQHLQTRNYDEELLFLLDHYSGHRAVRVQEICLRDFVQERLDYYS
jgi:hypothetical protein